MESTIRTKLRWIGHGLRMAMVRTADELDEENAVREAVNTVSRWIGIGMLYAAAILTGAGLAAWQIGGIV